MEKIDFSSVPIGIRTPTPGSRDSPRCQLRIPQQLTPDMLQQGKLELPNINKANSHRNSPLPLSPRIAKNKDIEFPDIYDRVNKDSQVINAKTVRGIKKHSSDKGIRTTKVENFERTYTYVEDKEALEKNRIFITRN